MTQKNPQIITYVDINNSYGWAISGYLPQDGFKWLKNVDGFDINQEKSLIGYIFKVDLEYPDELHVLHNDCPLAQFLKTCCQIIIKKLLTNMK